MKEEKSDDKATRPMFPMLHLNYADKVGPRAHPRNKMALYEQLSIPSHGYSSTTLSPHKPGTILKSTFSSQDGSHERTSYPSFCQPHSQLIPSAKKPYFASSNVKHMKTMESARRSTWVDFKSSFVAGSGDEGSSFNARDYLSEHNYFKLKSDDDDYFKVAALVQSTIAPHSKAAFVLEANMPAPSGASSISKSATFNSIIQSTTSGKPHYVANSFRTILKSNKQIHGEQESGKAVVCKKNVLDFPIFSEAVEILADPSESSLAAADRGTEIHMRCVERKGYQSTRIEKESFNIGSVKVLRSFDDMEIPESRIVSKMRSGSCSETLPGNCHISYDDKETDLVDLKDTDRNNEAPEATMVDLISGLNISLNDVVGILGSKKFWKVRRAIVKQDFYGYRSKLDCGLGVTRFQSSQQRVFAIQVFELHRVIKVQKLFAASPHLLVDYSDTFKLQSRVVTESLAIASARNLQQKIDSFQKPRQKAYSLVVKLEDSPFQTLETDLNKKPDQFPRDLSHAGNPPPIPMTLDMPNP